MDPRAIEFGVWMGVLAAVLVAAAYAIWYMRRRLLAADGDEDDAEEAPLYTTAEVERLKREGLIDDAQYEKLRTEAHEAAKRRAEKSRKRKGNKRGIFG